MENLRGFLYIKLSTCSKIIICFMYYAIYNKLGLEALKFRKNLDSLVYALFMAVQSLFVASIA